MTDHRTLPQIDEALDGARARWDHGDAQYEPEILALIRAAESMRAQLFGSYRDDVDPQPVFVLRARDRLSTIAVAAYLAACDSEGLHRQAEAVGQALHEFGQWQGRNPSALKLPDHEHVPALPHASDMAPLLGRLFDQDAAS